MLSHRERQATLAFLGTLNTSSGGWSSAPESEAGIRSTLSAAMAYALLGRSLPRPDGAFAFVRSLHDQASGGWRPTAAADPTVPATAAGILLLRELGALDACTGELPGALDFMTRHSRTSADHFMLIAVLEPVRDRFPPPVVSLAFFRDLEDGHGTFGPGVLDNAIAAGSLLRAGASLSDPAAVVDVLLSGEDAAGGFGEPGGRPDLWITYCVMRALDLLGRTPDAGRHGAWVRAMAAPGGGFALPGRSPDGDTTYQALSVLSWLVRPVLTAARSGDRERVRGWLAGGGDPDVRDLGGWTPLLAAASRGRADVVETLLAAEGASAADPSLRLEDADLLPVHLAAQAGDEGSVRSLLRAAPDDLFATSRVNGHTVLLQAAFYGSARHLALARVLLDDVADILGLDAADTHRVEEARRRLTVACNVRGYTGLTMSRLWENGPMARLFEEHDRSTEAEREGYLRDLLDSIARPPSSDPTESRKQERTEALIQAIQDALTRAAGVPAAEPDQAFIDAAVGGVRSALDAPDLEIDRLGGPLSETPLIVAVTGADATPTVGALRRELVALLLARGADPDVEEEHPMGVDAVIRAAVLNHFEILRMLAGAMEPLAFAAALNARPAINGQTALQDTVHRALTASDATLQAHLDQIRWSVAHGARPDIEDHTGTSPAGLTRKARSDAVYRGRAAVVGEALGLEPETPA